MFRKIVMLVGVLTATFGTVHTVSAVEELKLATLAPKDSTWGKVFSAWTKAVDEESHGSVKLTWFYNGTQGDEVAMVANTRSKQIDGAVLTATGLAQIYPHIIAFQMPGLFPTWEKLDAAREKTRALIEKGFEDQGFRLLGGGDVGIGHMISRGGPVRTPSDIKKFHPVYVPGDVINQKLLEVVGIASPRLLPLPAILPALSSRTEGAVDIVFSPSIAAEQLQWAAQLDSVNTISTGITIGGMVMSKERVAKVSPDARAVIERTGQNVIVTLTDRVRKMDAAAFARIKASKTVYEPTEADKAAWNDTFAKVRNALKNEGKINKTVWDAVVSAAGQ
ncbi:MAG: TRAP transporter substrate-binding protein DctP [Polyangiaceae bacterium]|nr:TRAP transporter substrate-binding protein DctP [Polyangiaceae bacterium]